MKNIQIFDGATNAVFDIFSATDEEFSLIFPGDTDVAFIDEVFQKHSSQTLDEAFTEIWKRRVPKSKAMGIHGILFYECEYKKVYYPTRRDEEAVNPDGTPLRYRLTNALRVGQPFSVEVVKGIFHASRIEFGAESSARDNLDVQNIYDALSPHIERIKRLRGNAAPAEIFKLIFEH